MVRNHRKPLKAMVATSKNHRKTIDGNGQTAQKHSMVMVSSKTIENLQWSLHFSGPPLCRPLCPWRRCFAKNSWGYLKVLSYFSQLFEISWYDIIIIWWYYLDQGLPSLTSKPLLTIALKILKTIEKPLVPMVRTPKKHSMVMVQLCQNHWKTIDGNGGLKKKH